MCSSSQRQNRANERLVDLIIEGSHRARRTTWNVVVLFYHCFILQSRKLQTSESIVIFDVDDVLLL